MVVQRRLAEILVHPHIPLRPRRPWPRRRIRAEGERQAPVGRPGDRNPAARDAGLRGGRTGRLPGGHAVEKTRTSTGLPPQAPQACASTIPPRPQRRRRAYSPCPPRQPACRYADDRAARRAADRRPAPLAHALGDRCPAAPALAARAGLTPYPARCGHGGAGGRDPGGHRAELVWLVEHPPLYTAGTSARPEDLADPGRFPTFDAGRGGQWTYHGPGQRTAYVMLDLPGPHGPVPAARRAPLRARPGGLADPRAAPLRRARRAAGGPRRHLGRPRRPREPRSRAIGVRVTRWVSWHGVALNVDPTLDHFGGIVPCGIARARRDVARRAGDRGEHGGRGRGAAGGLGGGVRVRFSGGLVRQEARKRVLF